MITFINYFLQVVPPPIPPPPPPGLEIDFGIVALIFIGLFFGAIKIRQDRALKDLS